MTDSTRDIGAIIIAAIAIIAITSTAVGLYRAYILNKK